MANTPTPPRGDSCVRACVCWGGAVSPHSPEARASSGPGSRGWAPFPRRRQGKMDLPSHIPTKKFWRPLHPQKIYSAPDLFSSLSFFPEDLPDFPLQIRCLSALLITSNPTHIRSACPQCQSPGTPRTSQSVPPGHPQASAREASEEISPK